MRMRRRACPPWGSRRMSLAPSAQARSARAATSRTVGAASSSVSPAESFHRSCTGMGAAGPPPDSSRCSSSTARREAGPPYRACTARSTAAASAIMGITCRWVAAAASSMAMKFSGSAMTRYSSARLARRGTT